MSAELSKVQLSDLAEAEQATAKGIAAWKKNRLCRWSRTDTARWLNDRSPAILAWLRRKPGPWPKESNQIGYWLKEYARRVFERAHVRLTNMPDEAARSLILPNEVLR